MNVLFDNVLLFDFALKGFDYANYGVTIKFFHRWEKDHKLPRYQES